MIISVSIYDPAKSPFKNKDKAECRVITCVKPEACSLYAKGECIHKNPFETRCPYGNRRTEIGYTKKARKYSDWLQERKSLYKDIPNLRMPSMRMCTIGEYVYLPYHHIPVDAFVKKEDFTISIVNKIIGHRPVAIFGGEITSYQREIVPTFRQHLQEDYPMFGIVGEISPIGRLAYLDSVPTGVVINGWVWDGEWLTIEDEYVFRTPVKFCATVQKIRPEASAAFKVTSIDQVDDETRYKV